VKRILPVALVLGIAPLFAADSGIIRLPDVRSDGGMPIMQALKQRHTTRDFKTEALSREQLGGLLWAAFGVNRPASGGRTAPSSRDSQEVDVYVALADGVYRYDAPTHSLVLVMHKDLRAMTGRQGFVADAPVNLVYVLDFASVPNSPREGAIESAAISAGAMVQNVYLYCASEGLGTVVRGWLDKPALAKAMGLGDDQYVLIAQTVGVPKK
jgi:SagB-type dehydrogenase family enzyme